MKKFLIAVTALLLLSAATLGGCGSPSDPTPAPPSETPGEETIEGLTVVSKEEVNKFEGDSLRYFGRTYLNARDGALVLDNAATGIETVFYGTRLEAQITPVQTPLILHVYLDGNPEGKFYRVLRDKRYVFAEDLEEGVHTVRIIKVTTSQHRSLRISDLTTDGKFLKPPKKDRPAIEFLGDSISVGGGILGAPSDMGSVDNSDSTRAFPYVAATALDADFSLVATDGICTKAKTALPNVNMIEMYGYCSSTTFLKYEHAPDAFDVVVIGTGTNDAYALSTGYTVEQFKLDYLELLELVREKNPAAKIVCVYGMMIRHAQVEQAIRDAAASMNDPRVTTLELPQSTGGAGAHPDVAGGKAQGEALADYLKTIL